MMPAQLWDTTMDPEKRLLKQLVVEDAAEANVVFSSLMGARVSNTYCINLNLSSFLFFHLIVLNFFGGQLHDQLGWAQIYL